MFPFFLIFIYAYLIRQEGSGRGMTLDITFVLPLSSASLIISLYSRFLSLIFVGDELFAINQAQCLKNVWLVRWRHYSLHMGEMSSVIAHYDANCETQDKCT